MVHHTGDRGEKAGKGTRSPVRQGKNKKFSKSARARANVFSMAQCRVKSHRRQIWRICCLMRTPGIQGEGTTAWHRRRDDRAGRNTGRRRHILEPMLHSLPFLLPGNWRAASVRGARWVGSGSSCCKCAHEDARSCGVVGHRRQVVVGGYAAGKW